MLRSLLVLVLAPPPQINAYEPSFCRGKKGNSHESGHWGIKDAMVLAGRT